MPPSGAAPVPDYVGKDAKLPVGVKLAYGAPNFAGAGMAIPIAIHMSIFYSDTVLLPLGYIALAVAVARAFDAITDPIMGWVTDRTNTRWGRRRPWMLLGAPLCALSFIALFTPPAGVMGVQAATWFTISFVFYFLFHTMYSIPHYGLGPELTFDYKERSSLFGWMEGFTVLGTIVAASAPAFLIPRLGGARAGYAALAIGMGAMLTLLYVWQCVRIKERPDFYQRKPNPLIPGVRRVMRNRPFRILLAIYLAGSITAAIPGLLMPFYTKYILQPEDPNKWIGIFLVTYFGSGFLLLPFWIRLTRWWGKKQVYLLTFPVGGTAAFSLFFLGEGDLVLCFWILVWAGSVFGVRLFLGPSMQADVIDYDELYTGKRREAQYGALWALMFKFTMIPSASVPLAILAVVGFEPNVQQTDTVQVALRAIFGFGPAATSIIAFAIALFFPIKEETHRKIIAGIQAHQRGEPARDPLTGRLVPPPSERGVDEETGWFLDHFSRRELRRYVDRGPAALIRGAVGGAVVSLAIFVVATGQALRNLGDLSTRPGLTTVFEVVVAGFALTAVLYHAMRLRAARRMRERPVPVDSVRAHLEVTHNLSPGGVAATSEPRVAAAG
jgi:GPH family glycoside/pentoside/hexuronide:cation symporter